MNDLLFTVRTQEAQNGVRGSPGVAYDIEAGYTTAQSEKSKEMEQFFNKVEELKQDMSEIRAKQREIQHMHERSKTIVRQKEMQQHRDEMQVSFSGCHAAVLEPSSTATTSVCLTSSTSGSGKGYHAASCPANSKIILLTVGIVACFTLS